MMKNRILLPFLFLLLALPVAGQDMQLERLAARLQQECVSLHYEFTLSQGVPVQMSGTLLAQDNCYRAKGNGVEIYCDGSTRWTVDPESREVYVEEAGSLDELRDWADWMQDLQLTDVQFRPKTEDLTLFRFDTAALDSSWVVTDLR